MPQKQISGEDAFRLYDTFGFPLDLTQLLAAERGLGVDVEGFHREMEKQRERARAAHQSAVITVADDEEAEATPFVGFEATNLESFETFVTDLLQSDGRSFLIFERTPFYAEMGGQIGDTGFAEIDGQRYEIISTIKDAGGRRLHELKEGADPSVKGKKALVSVEQVRRGAIQRHHTATHILHWALRKELGDHVRQAGSLVAPDRLRFDFSHFEAISAEKLTRIEQLCNERILANDPVRWTEVDFEQKPTNAIAFFGEKYGNRVRVVAIGKNVADDISSYESGWSVELCGGTHVCATGEIGLFKIVSESAISAGTRRIEAVCGKAALQLVQEQGRLLDSLAVRLSCKPAEVEARIVGLQDRQKDLERQLRAFQQKAAAGQADELAQKAIERNGLKVVAELAEAPDPNALRQLGVSVAGKIGEGVVILAGRFENKGTLLALASPEAVKQGLKAGDIVRDLTAKLGGKGGGKPDFAMGGISDLDNINSVLANFRAE